MKFNYNEISDFNLNVLKQAGWSEGRKVDIQHWLDYYKKYNFPGSESYREFLESFGGLHIIDPPKHPERLYCPGDTRFDPTYVDYEWAEEYQNDVQCTQYPLGTVFGDRGSLMLSDELNFYDISDRGVSFMGNNLSELFETIISATRKPKLIFDENGAVS